MTFVWVNLFRAYFNKDCSRFF